jgi:hypothetical protein
VLKWAKRNPSWAILLVVLLCWFFNLRLQWAWLDLSMLAVMLLVALARLRLWYFWATGTYLDVPLEPATDWGLMPGAAVALGVLCFYPGDGAARKQLAEAAVFIPFTWACGLGWLWRKRQAGRLVLALPTPRPVVIILSIALSSFILLEVMRNLDGNAYSADSFVNACSLLKNISLYLFLLLALVVGTDIRERGCVTFFRLLPWEVIAAQEWKPTAKGYQILQLKRRDKVIVLSKSVRAEQREQAERILKDRLPQA